VIHRIRHSFFVLPLLLALTGCGGDDDDATGPDAVSAAPVEPGSGGLTDFFGPIEGLDAETIAVDGRTFLVVAETVVLRQGAPVGFGFLAVGDPVVVKARQNGNGAWVAREIRLRVDATAPEAKLSGRVESVTPPALVVAGRTVQTNSATEFLGKGEPRALTDVHQGDLVTVSGPDIGDGVLLATKIRVESKG
jgi:hypothetical protein